jgi:hypothetical protein
MAPAQLAPQCHQPCFLCRLCACPFPAVTPTHTHRPTPCDRPQQTDDGGRGAPFTDQCTAGWASKQLRRFKLPTSHVPLEQARPSCPLLSWSHRPRRRHGGRGRCASCHSGQRTGKKRRNNDTGQINWMRAGTTCAKRTRRCAKQTSTASSTSMRLTSARERVRGNIHHAHERARESEGHPKEASSNTPKSVRECAAPQAATTPTHATRTDETHRRRLSRRAMSLANACQESHAKRSRSQARMPRLARHGSDASRWFTSQWRTRAG